MEKQLGEVLDNILGLLLLEGSYDLEETDDNIMVSVQTKDAGRLIGPRGENLDALQLLVNNIVYRNIKEAEFKKVVLDVEGWKKQKESYLVQKAKEMAQQVIESQKPLELEPMPAWQRRAVHIAIQDIEGVESESIGEGKDRYLVIKPKK